MIIIDNRKPFGLTMRQAFFPNASELDALVTGMTPRMVVRARQTSVIVGEHPWLVQRNACPTAVVDLTVGSERAFARMSRSCRQSLRRAADLGDRVRVTRNDPQSVGDFHALHNEFVKLSGHTTPMRIRELREWLTVGDLFMLYLDGKPFVGHVTLPDPQTRRVLIHTSRSKRHSTEEASTISARCNRHLHWLEIQHYMELGMELYDFAGVRDEDDPITFFKMSFGAVRLEEHFYVFARPALGLALRLNRAPTVQALHRLAGA